jgi:predicted CoA-binding protein
MRKAEAINDFTAQKRIAVVGVSRSGRKFGNMAYKELKARGYEVYPVNPSAREIDGERCYGSLHEIPVPVDGVLTSVQPDATLRTLRECTSLGVKRVWMQNGSESEEAIRFCQENGISEVHGECILMFAPPVRSFHGVHRFFVKLSGKLPR